MTLRIFITILFILTGLSPACGADLTVAVMKSDGTLPYEEVLEGFRAEFQNRTIRMVILEHGENRKQLDAQISHLEPDIILCLGTKGLKQADHIRGIPKVFSLITYAGIQPWFNRKDIFGVTLDLSPLSNLRSIRRFFPKSKRIGVLFDPEQNQAIIDDAKKIAPGMGFSLVTYPIRTMQEIPNILQELHKNIDLLWSLYDHTVYQPEPAKYILMQSLRKRIPFIGFSPYFAKSGALLALYGDYRDMGRQAAGQVMAIVAQHENISRILRPRKVRIAINEKVARAMDITFPPQILNSIDQIY